MTERHRASGLIPGLSMDEDVVVKARLAGKDPARALAASKGRERVSEQMRVRADRILASERVRRVIAGAVAMKPGEVRQYVAERLFDEAEEAREGAVRLKALELIGTLPGVDMWKPQDEREATLASAGEDLRAMLEALRDRLRSDVIDVEPEEIPGVEGGAVIGPDQGGPNVGSDDEGAAGAEGGGADAEPRPSAGNGDEPAWD